jgi:hypothetical protein
VAPDRLRERWETRAAALTATVLVLGGVGMGWLTSPHTPEAPMHVAQEFLRRLEARQFEQAFELTVRQGAVGRTPEELRALSERALCRVGAPVSTHPPQSQGNRLRRRLSGREVEMPEVRVEFAGGCLLGVTVVFTADRQWRVSRFASHAG